MKRLFAIFLCAVMLAATLAGCAPKEEPNITPSDDVVEESPTEESPTEETETKSFDFDLAYKTFNPTDVMMVADGMDVTWENFFYLLENYVGRLGQYYGTEIVWTDEIEAGLTCKDFVLESIIDWVKYSRAVENGAKDLGIDVVNGANDSIKAEWDAVVEQCGSEEAAQELLAERYCTKAFFDYIAKTNYFSRTCFETMFGSYGADLTDEELDEYYVDAGFMMAKHILIATATTDESGNSVPLSDEEIAAAREKAEGISAQLNSCSKDELPALFDQLMNENSEDPGLAMFPDGYLFQAGEMVPEFEATTLELGEGEVSGIVETQHGYHIIYKLPINYNVVASADTMYLQFTDPAQLTPRYKAAETMFNTTINDWISKVNVTYTEKYEAIDFETMLVLK